MRLLLVLLCLTQSGLCDRTSEKIYVDVEKVAMCFRKMNGTHQIGCSSKRGGNVGVLQYIQSDEEVDALVTNKTHAPYIALMTSETFVRANVDKLRSVEGLISGIMVAYYNDSHTEAPEDGFSPDSSCPNQYHDMYTNSSKYQNCKNQTWNSAGNALMFEDFAFPIVALSGNSEINFLINECFQKYNIPTNNNTEPDYPLCAVQIKDEMDGAKDSPTCIRRSNLVLNLNPDKYCDALGDYSVFSFSKLLNNSEPLNDNSVIVAAARLDSFTMYDGLYPGADSTVSGLVTLLAAARALGKMKDQMKTGKPIMYTFFNGEAFDYIGSDRIVYDMSKNLFPYDIQGEGPSKVTLNHLESFLEVSQVGRPINGGSFFLHSDPISKENSSISSQVDEIIKKFKAEAGKAELHVEATDPDAPLPPASLQSFLKQTLLPGVVIADHKDHFSNNYYNSLFDGSTTINNTYPQELNSTQRYDYMTDAAKKKKVPTATLR